MKRLQIVQSNLEPDKNVLWLDKNKNLKIYNGNGWEKTNKETSTITGRIDTTELFEHGKFFKDISIQLTKNNIKNYLNVSVEEIWNNLYDIDTFKFKVKYDVYEISETYISTYTNIDPITITKYSENDVQYIILGMDVKGHEIYDFREFDGVTEQISGYAEYQVYLTFNSKGELTENAFLNIVCDVDFTPLD